MLPMGSLVGRLEFHGRKIHRDVKKNEIVLDVGADNWPNPGADVYCDLYAKSSNFHRQDDPNASR